MNYFLRLELIESGVIIIRPEAVAVIERFEEEDYDILITTCGELYAVRRGQFAPNILINRTSHAGMRVL